MTCTGHALIRWYEAGRWWLRCANPGCGYIIQES